MKKYNITVNGTSYEVEVEEINEAGTTEVKSSVQTQTNSKPAPKKVVEKAVKKETPKAPVAESVSSGGTTVEAPMPGVILDIKVNVGDEVQAGDVILILEAMKMENEITAPASGKVSAIHASKGNNVGSGDVLISLN